jgi:2,3-bisphosphoglycerate-independent phosphoglycerate mutase
MKPIKNVKVVYNKDNITETLEVLEKRTKANCIAETEKYPHVTLLSSGGESVYHESRILKTQSYGHLRLATRERL